MAKLKKSSHTSSNGRRKSAAVAHVRRAEQRTIHFLTQDELRKLFKVIRSKRDKAIFLVAYRHGLRASEIGLLQRADVDVKQGRISIHRLKGSISGVYPMQPDALKAVRSYLRTRADASPYLFLSNRHVPISRYRPLANIRAKFQIEPLKGAIIVTHSAFGILISALVFAPNFKGLPGF